MKKACVACIEPLGESILPDKFSFLCLRIAATKKNEKIDIPSMSLIEQSNLRRDLYKRELMPQFRCYSDFF
jgi:hypothetical protein